LFSLIIIIIIDAFITPIIIAIRHIALSISLSIIYFRLIAFRFFDIATIDYY
jgi:hypothetical protein